MQKPYPKLLSVKLAFWDDVNEIVSCEAISKFLVKRDVAKTSQIFEKKKTGNHLIKQANFKMMTLSVCLPGVTNSERGFE